MKMLIPAAAAATLLALAPFAAQAQESSPTLNISQQETVVLATLASQGFGPGTAQYNTAKTLLDSYQQGQKTAPQFWGD